MDGRQWVEEEEEEDGAWTRKLHKYMRNKMLTTKLYMCRFELISFYCSYISLQQQQQQQNDYCPLMSFYANTYIFIQRKAFYWIRVSEKPIL